ncbi:MAG: AraC family transcriptional regulator, partial [Pseudomonadota bacterium]
GRRLSTGGGPKAFARWREHICEAYTALTPNRTDDAPFHGEIVLRDLDDGATLSDIAAGAQTVERRRSDIETRRSEACFVNFQLRGTARVRQQGIEAVVREGQAVVLDARRPFAMRLSADFQQLCLHLPFALLPAQNQRGASSRSGWDSDRGRLVARPLSRAAFAVDALFAEALSLREAPGTAVVASALLLEAFGHGRADRLADEHLALVRDYVARHATEALSPSMVAARFGISVRHLHGLFARAGTTFGRSLLAHRLEAARPLLQRCPHLPIRDIARQCGFASTSHFSRSYSQRYGQPPGAERTGNPEC